MAAPRLWMLGLGVVLAGALFALQLRHGHSHFVSDTTGPVISLEQAAIGSRAPSAEDANASSAISEVDPRTSKVSPEMRERLKLREKWLDSNDLDELIGSARNQDSEAQMALASRLLTCEGDDANDKPVQAAATEESNPPSASAANQGCTALRKKLLDGERSDSVWLKRAADNHSGPALLLEATYSPLGIPVEERVNALKMAFASRDPQVMLDLVLQAVLDSTYRNIQGNPANTRALVFGSILAQCDLGMDCSSEGRAFKARCSSGGIGCSHADSVQAILESRISPGQFSEALDIKTRLLDELDGPIANSPEAQAVLRQINTATQ